MTRTRRRTAVAKLSSLLLCALALGCAAPSAAPVTVPRLAIAEASISSRPLLLAGLEAPPEANASAPFIEALPGAQPALTPPRCVVTPSAEPAGLHRDDAPSRGRVVLTFDDGPYPDHTQTVLDSLERHQLSATFFVLGRHITARSYHLLQRMEAEGQTIGSHSYDHDIQMARHGDDDASIAYIRGQHEVTRVLIELALLARSPADFEAIATEVLGFSTERRLPKSVLERSWPEVVERHRRVLGDRGYAEGRYPVLYSRPPGGGPYLGRSEALRARYDEALHQLGMLNVMWHGLSGDVDSSRPRDYAFLTGKIEAAARRGGVLLIHDFIRADALDRALGDLARDSAIEVVAVDEALTDKYGCDGEALASYLAEPHTGQGRSATLGAL